MNKITYLFLALMLSFGSCRPGVQTTMNTVEGKLPRATPESVGVDPAGIESFYSSPSIGEGMEFHSIMVLRHGKVIAEKWWSGASPDSTHMMWSVSKSFTASAIGFAVSEGLLSLEDKVVSFFPDKAHAKHPLLEDMSVGDLMTMSTGQNPTDEEARAIRTTYDWVGVFLGIAVKDMPGTVFRYNSSATFMLSAILQRVSGEKLFDYLQPRLFQPLEIEGIKWDENPEGITVGGWGLHLKTEDMAKFGQLFLQKGVWNGKQLLPVGWVEEASSWKIDTVPSDREAPANPDSDWDQGYCYQMWRCRHNAYRAAGAYGQYIIVIPDKDAVVAVTANVRNMQDELNLIWDHILAAFK